jgi:hypothetical protein
MTGEETLSTPKGCTAEMGLGGIDLPAQRLLNLLRQKIQGAFNTPGPFLVKGKDEKIISIQYRYLRPPVDGNTLTLLLKYISLVL